MLSKCKKYSNKVVVMFKCLVFDYEVRLYMGVFGYVDIIVFVGYVKVLYVGLVGNVLWFMYIFWFINLWWVLLFEFV